jgi:DNA-binding transcriptional ArsR family regulator
MTENGTTDRIFKALAASTRRALLDLLKDHPRTTSELCTAFPDLDRCTVMLHLSVLKEADLIIVQRKGRERWNYLNPLPIKHIYDRWIGQYATQAVALLDRLAMDLIDDGEAAIEQSCKKKPDQLPSAHEMARRKLVRRRRKKGRIRT